MNALALVTDEASLPDDYDMRLLLDACRAVGFAAEVRSWEDPAVDWSDFDAVLLRSPWSYVDKLPDFLEWCERVSAATRLLNPLPVVRWSLDKHYLADLAAYGVPVVPSSFVAPGADPLAALREFLTAHPRTEEVVVKPTVGAYSRDVRRFPRSCESEAVRHMTELTGKGHHAILQPYLTSIDRDGESDLIYFDGSYSHAIRKNALLMSDGTAGAPTFESRRARDADEDERAVASAALGAAASHLGLEQALLYARVDLVRDDDGKPMVLELELCEPSLNLPFTEGGATRFARALAARLNPRGR
ncbi:hypothetical protein LUW75_09290 [Streptomyces sp. MRC013]|uniref:ATP-grasp domain-containing protein n=1 Tax=Streptomyces sp. MRC013 TaxID=2898276 RepID=UPI002027375C|nr:hypothetical protein [Streptomyces sp. MRC013]URM90149.1 hypothetical protein LUW75_09290 [Streptomyces sp. MRC013]